MVEAEARPWRTVESELAIGKLRIAAPGAETRLSAALGCATPEAGRMTGDPTLACLRVGPFEWLLLGDRATVEPALDRASAAFASDLALILDMTHGSHVLSLSGPRAIERVAAYCDLDLRPTAFPAGSATRTRFGDVAVTLVRLNDLPTFWLIADQSHADYLRRLLDHGASPSKN